MQAHVQLARLQDCQNKKAFMSCLKCNKCQRFSKKKRPDIDYTKFITE